jgi:hypothetical protein
VLRWGHTSPPAYAMAQRASPAWLSKGERGATRMWPCPAACSVCKGVLGCPSAAGARVLCASGEPSRARTRDSLLLSHSTQPPCPTTLAPTHCAGGIDAAQRSFLVPTSCSRHFALAGRATLSTALRRARQHGHWGLRRGVQELSWLAPQNRGMRKARPARAPRALCDAAARRSGHRRTQSRPRQLYPGLRQAA